MDRYRLSEIYQSELNRSNLSDGEVKSNLQSVIEYQKSQMSVMKIIKYLSLLLTIIVVILVFTLLLGQSSSIRDCPVEESQFTYLESFKYNVFGVVPDCNGTELAHQHIEKRKASDSIWDIIKPSSSNKQVDEFQRKLKEQSFSVQGFLPSLPEYEYIRKNRNKFELSNELNSSCFDGGNQLDCDHYRSVSSAFESIFEVSLNQNSSRDDFVDVKKKLVDQSERYKDAERLLDNEFLDEVRLNVNDLSHSYRNYLNKKGRLNEFQEKFYVLMKKLEGISDELGLAKREVDEEKLKGADLDSKIAEANRLLEYYTGQINEKKNTLSAKEKERFEALKVLDEQINDLKKLLSSKPKIEAEISQKTNSITRNEALILQKEERVRKVREELAILRSKKADNEVKEGEFTFRRNQFEKTKLIHTIKLKAALKNREIKLFLDGLVDESKDINSLEHLMGNKINDQKELLEQIERYKEESKKMDSKPGTIIEDQETGNSEEIRSYISKDQEDLENIKSKYEELIKVVGEYKDSEIEINNRKTKILDIDRELKDLEKERKNYFKDDYNIQDKIDRLEREINNLENDIANLRRINSDNNEFIQTKTAFIRENEQKLEELLRQRRELSDALEVG